jgi:hypothetical protein
MAETETETPVSKVIANILKAAREQPKQPKPQEVAKVMRRIYPEKTATPDAKQDRVGRIIENAKQVVAEAKTQGVHVSTGLHEWVGRNKLSILDADPAQAFRIAKADLAVAIKASGLPKDHWVTQAASRVKNAESAQALAIIALAPKEVRENPNFIFQTAAQLAGSNLDPETQLTVKAFVSGLKDLRGVDGFNMSDDEVSQALIGYQFSEDQIDEIKDVNLKKIVQDHNNQMKFITTDELGVLKKDLNYEEMLYELQKFKQHLRDGLGGKSPLDEKEARRFYDATELREQGIRKQTQRLQAEAEKNRYGYRETDFKAIHVKNGKEFFNEVDKYRGRLSVVERRQIQERYKDLKDPKVNKEKGEFCDELEKNMRLLVGALESNDKERWRLNGLTDLERQLNEYHEILNGVDLDRDRAMMEEFHARQWEHDVSHSIRTSASPQFGELKEFLGEFGQLSEIGFFDATLRLPGVSRGLQLLEQYAPKLIASEMNSTREAVMADIAKELLKDDGLVNAMAAKGMTAESALRLADRHFMLTGRDGEHYKEFIHANNLIEYVTDKEGHKVGVVKETAPMFWNFFRLLYCPEAQITFFHMGADMTGGKETLWRNGQAIKNVVSGQGVGAEVIYSLMKNHYSLDMDDFYSRRHKGGYLVKAWGWELFDTKNINPIPENMDKVDPYWKFNLLPEIKKVGDPTTDATPEDFHNIWYSEAEDGSRLASETKKPLLPAETEFRALERMYLHAKVGEDFALKMGMTDNPDPEKSERAIFINGIKDSEGKKVVKGRDDLLNSVFVTKEGTKDREKAMDALIKFYDQHTGTVTWEDFGETFKKDLDRQRVRMKDALESTPLDKMNKEMKSRYEKIMKDLDDRLRVMQECKKAFNDRVVGYYDKKGTYVQGNTEHARGPWAGKMEGVKGYEVDQFMDLTKADLSKFTHTRLWRQAELARGNIRDHAAALTVLMKTLNFIGNPSMQNFNQFDIKDSTVYMPPGQAQAHVIVPAYEALMDVQRGHLGLGWEIYSIPKTRSKYGQVYHVKSLTDAALYKFGLTVVSRGNMTMDQLIHVRGGSGRGAYVKHAFEELGRNVDFGMMGVVLFAAIQKQLEKLEKEEK